MSVGLTKIRKSTCAKDVREGAVAWAKAIAKDNRFHYGYGTHAHHNGCYFCGTQHLKKGHGINKYLYTYCCNPFVGAAFAHGGGEPEALKLCKKCSSWDFHTYTSPSYHKSKVWKQIHPSKITDLIAGDVMCSNNHVKLYIGDKKVCHAHGGDNNKEGTSSWNGSISISSCTSISGYRCYRYIGKGGSWMCLPNNSGVIADSDTDYVDNGQGISLEKEISTLYSSDNYEYITWTEDNQESASVTLFKDSIQKALDLQFTAVNTESGAVSEIIVGTALKELNYNFDKNKIQRLKSAPHTNLVSYPNVVEAPTIVLDFNGVKIGGYGNRGDMYPNYITSMSIQKINGRINQYTLNLSYQIRPGEDPNFIDKLLSRTGYTNPLKILYGDSMYPVGYFREEEAVITNATHVEDTGSCKIDYTITALSSVVTSIGTYTNYPAKKAKPSTLIYDLLYNSGEASEALLSAFPGMKNKSLVASSGLIPDTDAIVQIGGLTNANPLSRLTHLVSCMKNDAGESSSYYLAFCDDNALEGSYFKIREVKKVSSETTYTNDTVFDVDINYPTDNMITNFQICNNDYWSLAYEFAGEIPYYEYDIDNEGNITQKQSNILHKNNQYNELSLVDENWWKQVTEFPISAKLTLKGLVTPAMLMSYINVNAYFYGQKDMASGLYVVTEETDTISGSGYSTELTLLRVAE